MIRKASEMNGFLSKSIPVVVAILFSVVVLTAEMAVSDTKYYRGKPAKFVFFFIGDGMGIPQRTAAEKYRNIRLVMDTFPAHGITSTYAADRFITGSAAASTALGCGQKTNVGMVGMAPDQRPVKSVAELARDKGMKVGIISSVSIDHATPAAFYSHVKKRSHYYDIAVALAESGFDFFGGGGLKDPTNKKGNSENFRGDARELIKNAGYQVINNKTDFMNLKKEDGKVLAINEWLQDHKALPFAMDMTKQDITLAEFTSKAIDMLENPNGFFLLVEGGKIDWACHANDAVAAITNTIAFDSAIQEAVRFAERFPEDTLIVVTGDHECGGLTLGFAGTKYATYFEILGNQNVSFQRFSDEILKTYKNGCQGDCRFDDLKPIISKHFGLRFAGDPETDMMVLKDYQVQMLREAYFRSMLDEKLTSKDPMTSLLYGGYEPLTIALTHLLNNKAGLGWTSYKHTGVPVSTSAMGVGAEIFNGYYDNADVAKKIMSVMGLEPKIYYALHEAPSRISARY